MQSILRNTVKLAVMLLLAAALLGGAGIASAASLPASACVSVSGSATCELWATTGTATLFGSTTVSFWGYSASATPGSAILPGPVLTVTQGDNVTVTLHNGLAEPTALFFQGQSLAPDTTGIAAGGTSTYTFLASRPGTFLYEAGLVAGKQHQVAMGMYGALVVKPADGTAYGSAGSAYNEEALLVLSEFDPILAASPTTFDMRNYAPKYFLINGQAYAPGFTGDIGVTAGNKVLLRYVNAGLQSHAMSTLGVSQSVIAMDGYAFAHPHSMVAETIATGQTLDALVTIPAGSPDLTKFAVYDANLMLRNDNASGFGGMLSFLTVGAITPLVVDSGPSVSNLALAPNPTKGSVDVTVNATITDSGTTATNISAAEFYIDSTAGSPTAMTASDGAFDSSSEAVTGTIPVATLAGFASGNHTIFVRGMDSASPSGNWGPFLSITLNLDKAGPTTSGLTLSPNPSSGAVSVALTATGNDTASGNSNVTAAEYWVDIGAHTAMTVNGAVSSVTNFTATIPAGLSMGSHVVSVRSQDAFGNWGAVATINLQVADTAGPTTTNVIAAPNPNNGSKPFSTSVQAVRVTASFSDLATGNSNLAAAEGFIDRPTNHTPPTPSMYGTGFVFIASDGAFSSPSETGYSDIALAVFSSYPAGNYTIYVHAKDAAGNWGAMATTVLVIDKTAPTVLSITRAGPNPTNAASVQFTVTFSESVTGGAVSNFSLTTQGVNGASITSVTGSGNTRTVTVNTGTNTGGNTHTIRLNVANGTGIADLAGNALTGNFPISGGTSGTYTIDKTAPTVSSINRANPNPTTAASVSFTVTFSESVTGGAIGNFALTTTGTYSVAPLITSISGTGATRTVTISTGTNTGTGTHTIRLDMVNSIGVADLAGNAVSNLPYTSGQSYTKN
jgi:FtsP/CotA-like multicopper oxidase with cupredoxin domain